MKHIIGSFLLVMVILGVGTIYYSNVPDEWSEPAADVESHQAAVSFPSPYLSPSPSSSSSSSPSSPLPPSAQPSPPPVPVESVPPSLDSYDPEQRMHELPDWVRNRCAHRMREGNSVPSPPHTQVLAPLNDASILDLPMSQRSREHYQLVQVEQHMEWALYERVTLIILEFDQTGQPVCNGVTGYEGGVIGERYRTRILFLSRGDGVYTGTFPVLEAGEFEVSLRMYTRESTVSASLSKRWRPAIQPVIRWYLNVNIMPTLHLKRIEKKAAEQRSTGERRLLANMASQYRRTMCPPSVHAHPSYEWQGVWVRVGMEGCQQRSPLGPYCAGDILSVSRMRWIYVQPHCYHRLFAPRQAWQCMKQQWLVYQGGTRAADAARIMIDNILGIKEDTSVEVSASFDQTYRYERDPTLFVRISVIPSGAVSTLSELRWSGLQPGLSPNTLVLLSGEEEASERDTSKTVRQLAAWWRAFVKTPIAVVRKWMTEAENALFGFLAQAPTGLQQIVWRSTTPTGGACRSSVDDPKRPKPTASCPSAYGEYVGNEWMRAILSDHIHHPARVQHEWSPAIPSDPNSEADSSAAPPELAAPAHWIGLDAYDVAAAWQWEDDGRVQLAGRYGAPRCALRRASFGCVQENMVEMMAAHILMQQMCEE